MRLYSSMDGLRYKLIFRYRFANTRDMLTLSNNGDLSPIFAGSKLRLVTAAFSIVYSVSIGIDKSAYLSSSVAGADSYYSFSNNRFFAFILKTYFGC
jgi:hypothetical protein